MACAKCHATGLGSSPLGPDLANLGERRVPSNKQLVDAVLRPSKEIIDPYQTTSILLASGKVEAGVVVSEKAGVLELQTSQLGGKPIRIAVADIELRKKGSQSLMPAGQVHQLSGRQEFLDLIAYLIAIRDGGPSKARQLQPPPHLLVAPPIPEYEKSIDHAGMISQLTDEALGRGEKIYSRLCVNCHGTHDQPGSLPTSLRFASGKFKNGSDPYSMYQTLTRGFGMMLPQSWMVPQQKYDVIHYIRQAYLRSDNPSQYFHVTQTYLDDLPKGDSRGPAPVEVQPWVNMDYGPSMMGTFETGDDASNFAYKGIAMRLDARAGGMSRGALGGVSRGSAWSVFDHDTMRLSVSWAKPASARGEPFIDWNGIHFNGRHNIHPRIRGDVHLQNRNGPGWANPQTGSFNDPRLIGRDGRKYGPLPADWAKLDGVYSYGPETIIDYQIGETKILESPVLLEDTGSSHSDSHDSPASVSFGRRFNIGPRDRPMILQVASIDREATLRERPAGVEIISSAAEDDQKEGFSFGGESYAFCPSGDQFQMNDRAFTILARIKTRNDGAIFTQTTDQSEWVPGGKSLFIRGGRLTYDIGWVGAARSKKRVNDGRWHDVAMTSSADGRIVFYVDGKPSGGGSLRPKREPANPVIRIGFTAEDFPAEPYFDGDLQHVQFIPREMTAKQIREQNTRETIPDALAHWKIESDLPLSDAKGKFSLQSENEDAHRSPERSLRFAGLSSEIPQSRWYIGEGGRLCLSIPKGDSSLRFVLWTQSTEGRDADHGADGHRNDTIDDKFPVIDDPQPDLQHMTQGGPPRWPDKLTTTVVRGDDQGPFAVDVLTAPAMNPWQARVRLTGFDFFDDGDSMAVCAWDGDVWRVTGLSQIDHIKNQQSVQLTWQRIASGLFQPLGLKIVDGRIYVSCRDQICILNDLNGDYETDFYECFNRDHQVTDHFHEFAMGLQTDADGNFYYAKSARHALKALVPHHGTLLRVSKDGSRTDILANGFRAANGVCLNPDGTFIVTDQEGHWNPKNRINWVRPGGFYGNMFGYHDVTDSSDEAMEQPLCWITNAFDRSPAELLWVDSEKWGPLNGRLLNLSYGYGKVYLVPHEDVGGQKQGGMIALPIPQFPTGVMRGRFRSADQQLYLCGMFAWAGSQQQDGGLYRLRHTGKTVHLPVELSAKSDGIELQFSGELDRKQAEDAKNYSVRVWSLKRTANYGSKHYNEKELDVTNARLGSDNKTVTLTVPTITPTWCMEIRYRLESTEATRVEGTLHNTIHRLRER